MRQYKNHLPFINFILVNVGPDEWKHNFVDYHPRRRTMRVFFIGIKRVHSPGLCEDSDINLFANTCDRKVIQVVVVADWSVCIALYHSNRCPSISATYQIIPSDACTWFLWQAACSCWVLVFYCLWLERSFELAGQRVSRHQSVPFRWASAFCQRRILQVRALTSNDGVREVRIVFCWWAILANSYKSRQLFSGFGRHPYCIWGAGMKKVVHVPMICVLEALVFPYLESRVKLKIWFVFQSISADAKEGGPPGQRASPLLWQMLITSSADNEGLPKSRISLFGFIRNARPPFSRKVRPRPKFLISVAGGCVLR